MTALDLSQLGQLRVNRGHRASHGLSVWMSFAFTVSVEASR